jgi:hypothetical protein
MIDMDEILTLNGLSAFIKFEDLKFDLSQEPLGKGGYGEVYKGTWEGAPVAIKKFGRN